MSAAMMFVCLASSMTAGQAEDVVFKAPLIEVKNASAPGKEFRYLMYNGVYMGRQYQKYEGIPDPRRLPTTYFHDKSPIGIVLGDAKSFSKEASRRRSPSWAWTSAHWPLTHSRVRPFTLRNACRPS